MNKMIDVVADVKNLELCDTAEHAQILIHALIEKVIEGKDKQREEVAKFLLVLADQIKNIEFGEM